MLVPRRCTRGSSPLAALSFVCVASLVTACGADPPLSPENGSALLASGAGTGSPAPSNLTARAEVLGQIDLAWQDNSSNETGFEVRGSSDGPDGTFTEWTRTAANATGTSFTGLGPSESYCFKVRAFTTKGQRTHYSESSNTACATTLVPPPPKGPKAPSGTVATPAASTRVLVRWVDNSDDEEWFRVERAPTSDGPWEFVGTWLGSGYTSYTDWGRPSERPVCYRVIARNDEGDSAPSNIDCTTPPAAPSGLTAVDAAGPSIDLAWTDNSSVEDGYEVRRASPGEQWVTVAELPANTTSYRDAAVTLGKSYYYEVRAMKDAGFSDYSNSVSIVAGGVVEPPAKPGLEPPRGYYLGTMWLYWWNDPATVDSTRIERCDKATCEDADFALIATISADVSSMSYQDWGLADWTIYTYRIRAINQVGESAPSDPMQGRTCIEEVDWESPCFPPLPGSESAAAVVSPSRRWLDRSPEGRRGRIPARPPNRTP